MFLWIQWIFMVVLGHAFLGFQKGMTLKKNTALLAGYRTCGW